MAGLVRVTKLQIASTKKRDFAPTYIQRKMDDDLRKDGLHIIVQHHARPRPGTYLPRGDPNIKIDDMEKLHIARSHDFPPTINTYTPDGVELALH
jgi:hypothetical protein